MPTKIPSAPYTVSLMITRRCNLRCLYCGSSAEQFLREDMTTEEILAVIEDLARCGVLVMAITGGEPLVHPDFFPIVHAILRHPMRLQINTNATVVTEKIVDGFRQLPRRPSFSVTIDGITPETYRHIRGGDGLAAMEQGIRRLTTAGFRVRPFVILNRLNRREMTQIVAFAKSVGVKTVNIAMPLACGRAPQHTEEIMLQPDELQETLETVLRIDEKNPRFLTGPWMGMLRFYRDLKEGRLTGAAGDGSRLFRNCGGALTQVTIASDGTVVPCDLTYTCRAGNVRDEPFPEIWRHSPVFQRIRACFGMPLTQVHTCGDCPWHHTCRGPCPADGYVLTGVWPAASPTCVKRQIGRLFGYETAVQQSGKASS